MPDTQINHGSDIRAVSDHARDVTLLDNCTKWWLFPFLCASFWTPTTSPICYVCKVTATHRCSRIYCNCSWIRGRNARFTFVISWIAFLEIVLLRIFSNSDCKPFLAWTATGSRLADDLSSDSILAWHFVVVSSGSLCETRINRVWRIWQRLRRNKLAFEISVGPSSCIADDPLSAPSSSFEMRSFCGEEFAVGFN